MDFKLCKDCGEYKALSEFYRKKDSRDKLQPKCKTCQRACFEKHYSENKEIYKNRVKEWRKNKHGN